MTKFSIGDVVKLVPFGMHQYLVVDVNEGGLRVVIARPGEEHVCNPSHLKLLAKATK